MKQLCREIGRTVRYALASSDRTGRLIALMIALSYSTTHLMN
jgi:hypothetical protein